MSLPAVLGAASLAICVLVYCAMRYRVWFKCSATFAKWFSFNIEVRPQGRDDDNA